MAFGINLARELYGRARRPLYEMFGSDRYSHLALNDLDQKLKRYLDFENGFFIEAGGNDGLTQSNTYWFERFRGWRGFAWICSSATCESSGVCPPPSRTSKPISGSERITLVMDSQVAWHQP